MIIFPLLLYENGPFGRKSLTLLIFSVSGPSVYACSIAKVHSKLVRKKLQIMQIWTPLRTNGTHMAQSAVYSTDSGLFFYKATFNRLVYFLSCVKNRVHKMEKNITALVFLLNGTFIMRWNGTINPIYSCFGQDMAFVN